MPPTDFAEIERTLKVGDLVKLRAEIGHSQRSYNGRVAGWQGDRMLVAVPEGSPLLFIGASEFKVAMRKETDNALYVVDALAKPRSGPGGPELSLRIVGDLQRIQRRWNVRLSVLIDPEEALLLEGEEEKPFKATILDLSAGGVLLHTREPVPIGAKLRLAFPLPGLGRTIRAEAEAVRLMQLGSEGWQYFRIGASFLDLGREQEDAIIKFAFQEQLRRRRLERLP